MAYSQRAWKAFNLRRKKPFQQFGQSYDRYTANGATGCTHTVLQFLALLWKNRWYTHDEISRMVGYPNQSAIASRYRRGLRPAEVQLFCQKAGLPYRVALGLTADQALAYTRLGPVGFGMAYSHVPEWKGYRYSGMVADGRPNGFARYHGKTQLVGFTGAHFGCVLADGTLTTGARAIVAWEPNHGSTARPEKPEYDMYSITQWRTLFNSYNTVLRRSTYALVPTRYLPL